MIDLSTAGHNPTDDDRDTDLMVTVDERQGQGVLVINGEISVSTAPVLAALFVALDNSDQEFVIDLSPIIAVDEIGATMLVKARQRLAGRDQEGILTSPTPTARRVQDSMGVNDVASILSAADATLTKTGIPTKFDVLRRPDNHRR